MHSVLWASILASAGVALVTTLLVEYLAKPWLEARKDRIVEKNRDQRKGIKDVWQAVIYTVRLQVHIDRVDTGAVLPEYIDKTISELSGVHG